jgi:hypothetical protein
MVIARRVSDYYEHNNHFSFFLENISRNKINNENKRENKINEKEKTENKRDISHT